MNTGTVFAYENSLRLGGEMVTSQVYVLCDVVCVCVVQCALCVIQQHSDNDDNDSNGEKET